MKSQEKLRRKVLDILAENLINPRPEVVSINVIATRLQLNIGETRQLLLRMDQTGEIQSDIEGNYSLITPTGLSKISSQKSDSERFRH